MLTVFGVRFWKSWKVNDPVKLSVVSDESL